MLFILEGQAYFKETEKKGSMLDTGRKSVRDDGSSSGEEVQNGNILAGDIIGHSKFASDISQGFYDQINGENGRTFHGAGLRYNEKPDGSDALIEECRKFLPVHVQRDESLKPYTIQVKVK